MKRADFETLNQLVVTATRIDEQSYVMVRNPPHHYSALSREEALMFAAWLVAMATVDDDEDGSDDYGDIQKRVDAVRSA